MNEYYKKPPETEKDISSQGAMRDILRQNLNGTWNRRKLTRACDAANEVLDSYIAQHGDAMDVFVQVGGSQLYLQHEEKVFASVQYGDKDTILWGEVKNFKIAKIDDDTNDGVDTLCAQICTYDGDESTYLVPIARAGQKGLLSDLVGAPYINIDDENTAHMPKIEQLSRGREFREYYKELLEETIFLDGHQMSQYVHEKVSQLYDEGDIANLDEFSSVANMYFALERREGGMYDVDFNGDVEIIGTNGVIDTDIINDKSLELGGVEFIVDEAAPGGVRSYAYMVDENDTVMRSDMYENNFYIERVKP